MAKSAKDSFSVIRDAFSPLVGVVCSEDAAELCRKSCLSFAEMVQPFCRLSSEAHARDASGNAYTLTDFRVVVRDAATTPPTSAVGASMLSSAVSCSNGDAKDRSVVVGSSRVLYSGSTPWYEEYRECFLAIGPSSDHEFLKHQCACIFVVSSAHDEPLECFQRLADSQLPHNAQQSQQQQQQPGVVKSPAAKWLTPDYLRYFVLLHDVVSGDESRAEAVYQTVKARYGAQACHLLKINSVQLQLNGTAERSTATEAAGIMAANPWSSCLRRNYSTSDATPPIDYADDVEPDVTSTAISSGNDGVDFSHSGVDTSGSPLKSSLQLHHPLLAVDPLAAVATTQRRHPTLGCRLSLSDQDRLRIFIRELVVRALVPWVERTIRALIELSQSKKGLNRGLFKKWFNTKPNEKPSDVVQYAPDSAEMHQRRLADLYFMFQMYDPAYQLYHSLKKDFETDKAWMYCAGSQEMAALAIFMLGDRTQRPYPTHYMDAAISSYATTCRSDYFALRATMLNVEALKAKGLWMQASGTLLKMCNDDASLRSALLLEQAAHCFLAGGVAGAGSGRGALPSTRKFAWYLVLAADRFMRAGQKAHALRCLGTALQVHDSCGWTLAQDHVNILCGRLRSSSADTGDQDLAYAHFASTLRESFGQTAAQQDVYLREFLEFCLGRQQPQQPKPGELSLPLLPVPAVCRNDISILTCRYEGNGLLQPETIDDRVYSTDGMWQVLEDCCVALCKAQGLASTVVSPGLPCYTRSTVNTCNPSIPVGELLTVRVCLRNPLLVPLLLSDVRLLWQFRAEGDGSCSDSSALYVSHALDEQTKATLVEEVPLSNIVLDSGASNYVEFGLRLRKLGMLVVSGLQYKLGRVPYDLSVKVGALVHGRLELAVQGRRLHQTKADLLKKRCAVDKRLEIAVLPAAPKIKAVFGGFPNVVLCGELRQVCVRLENVGHVPLGFVALSCSDPANVLVDVGSVCGSSSAEPAARVVSSRACLIPLPGGCLEPAQAVNVTLWLRGPDDDAVASSAAIVSSRPMDFVFCYAGEGESASTRLRFSRHSFNLVLEKSLNLSIAVRSWGSSETGDSLFKRLLLADVENRYQLSQDRTTEFSIIQLDSYSDRWSTKLVHSCKDANLLVNQGEAAKLCLKASRNSVKKKELADTTHTGCSQLSVDESIATTSTALPERLPQDAAIAQDHVGLLHCRLLSRSQEKTAVSSTTLSMDWTVAGTVMYRYASLRALAPPKLCVDSASGSTVIAPAAVGLTDKEAAAVLRPCSVESCVLAVFWKACTILATGEMREAYGIHALPVSFEQQSTEGSLASAAGIVTAPSTGAPSAFAAPVPAHISASAAGSAIPPAALRSPAVLREVSNLSSSRQGSVGSDLSSLQQFDTSQPTWSGGGSVQAPAPMAPERIVRYCYRHPARFDVDFSKQRLPMVPVMLQLENLASDDVDVMVVAKRSPPDGLPDGVQWAGKMQTRLRLPGREQAEVALLAAFAAEGTYSLNTLDVLAAVVAGSDGRDQMTAQRDTAPALIVISDVDSAVG